MNRKSWTVAVVLGLSSSLSLVGCANHGEHEDEVVMNLADIPAAAREGIRREAGPGATIGKVEQEKHHGQLVYEAEVMSGGQAWEIKVDPAGKLVSKEKE